MKFISEFFTKRKKVSIYATNDSYRLVSYQSEDGKVKEKLFNQTNLVTPARIKSKDNEVYLYKVQAEGDPRSDYRVPKGHRFFRYKTKKELFREKFPVLKVTWANNVHNCNKRYDNFQEYIEADFSNKMTKKVLTIDTSTTR